MKLKICKTRTLKKENEVFRICIENKLKLKLSITKWPNKNLNKNKNLDKNKSLAKTKT